MTEAILLYMVIKGGTGGFCVIKKILQIFTFILQNSLKYKKCNPVSAPFEKFFWIKRDGCLKNDRNTNLSTDA